MRISPIDSDASPPVVLPDVSIVTAPAAVPMTGSTAGSGEVTSAVIEAEEIWETETHYSLVIRREPENQVIAAMEMLSPSNKGLGNRLDRERHLRKRAEYLDAGINLLELDALRHGKRDLPQPLTELARFDRIAWMAYHLEGRRKYRGWGWNAIDPLPQIDWQVDSKQTPILDLGRTLEAAADFNRWNDFVAHRPTRDSEK